MGRPKNLIPFKLTNADRRMMDVARDDYPLFCQYYFDWIPKWYQTTFYNAPQKNKLFVAGIRTGKSKGVATGALHKCWRNANYRFANASISSDQANIVFQDILGFLESEHFGHWVEDISRHPYPKIRLVNGSEMWFRSIGFDAELWRGHDFDEINVDEAAYVPRELAIKTLRGRLLGVGRAGIFTMTTSPKGKGWLYDLWRKGNAEFPDADLTRYFSLRARTRDNDSLTDAQIREVEADYTTRMIAQELDGLFLDSADTIFPYDQIMAACDTERPEVNKLQKDVDLYVEASNQKFDELSYYQLPPVSGHLYLNSWDLGKKTTKAGRNAMVGMVLDITQKPWPIVGYRWAANAQYGQAHQWIKEWDKIYNVGGSCETVIDATGKGDILNDTLTEEDNLEVQGINYSGGTKYQIVHALQMAMEKGWIVYPFLRRMIDQMQAYELPDDHIAQDIVMTLGQAAFRARQRTGEDRKVMSLGQQVTSARRPIKDESMRRFRDRRKSGRRAIEYNPNPRTA